MTSCRSWDETAFQADKESSSLSGSSNTSANVPRLASEPPKLAEVGSIPYRGCQTKVCKKCGIDKPLSEYHKKAANPTGYQPRCKECNCADVNEWRKEQSPERLQELYLQRVYGLSLQDYHRLLLKQKNCCPICNLELNLGSYLDAKSPVVDHCHKTGVVRGILHNECNRGIGYLGDDPVRLLNAYNYLSVQGQSTEGGQ